MTLALLVTGGTGNLGTDLARVAVAAGADVTAPGSAELDVTQPAQVVSAVREFAAAARKSGADPVLVNAAAYTAVDDAESDENRAFAVNADGPRVLAAACTSHRVPLVHVSTDYVFDGEAETPYEPEDAVAPQTAYGRTKAAGEAAVVGSGATAWVVRTAWLYGAASTNFVRTMARLESERDTVDVVDDQHGTPTYSADLASGLLQLAERIAAGQGPERQTLHCTNAGSTTWFGCAREIFRLLGADPERVRPCSTADFPRPARRPRHTLLSPVSWSGTGLTPLRPWQEALADFLRH